MTGYQTGDANRLTSDSTYSYEYDEEGNRTLRTNTSTGEKTEYEWDHRNRLVKVTEKDAQSATTQVVEYTYDVFNRRIAKEVDTSSPFDMADAAIERYVYDDIHNSLASLDGGNVVLDFVDPDGSGAQPMVLSKRYLYGQAVDQILSQEDVTKDLSATDRVLWPLVDNLGTVRDLAKQDGTIATHFVYDTFGNVTSGDTSLTRYLFTSREFDTDTELQYNRARWYDAQVGRWISEDPLGFVAGDANVGRFVSNDPTGQTDPSGLRGFWGDYWYYLTNPSQMDSDLRIANGVAYGMIGAGVGGLAGVGAGAAIISIGGGTVGGSLTGTVVGGTVGSIVGSPGGKIGQIIGGVGGGAGGMLGNGLLSLVVLEEHVAGVVFYQLTLGDALAEVLAASVTTVPYMIGTGAVTYVVTHPIQAWLLAEGVVDGLEPGPPTTPIGLVVDKVVVPSIEKALEE